MKKRTHRNRPKSDLDAPHSRKGAQASVCLNPTSSSAFLDRRKPSSGRRSENMCGRGEYTGLYPGLGHHSVGEIGS
jgi:hypothetical protein